MPAHSVLRSLMLVTVCCLGTAVASNRDMIVRLKQSTWAALEGVATEETTSRYRHSEVHRALLAVTESSQRGVLSLLARHGAADRARAFWIDNVIAVPEASSALVEELISLEEVLSVDDDTKVYLPEMESEMEATPKVTDAKPQGNIAALNTGPLWDAGISGQGVTVASIDSGVRWTHEALKANYRGYRGEGAAADHDYAFWTPKSTPITPDNVDIYGHGTHVTGTLAGSGPHNIGMAPNATWIHAKAFSWDGSASQSDLIAAAQWVLCPTKYDHSEADCSKGAHVISCSFGGNSSLTWLNPSVKAMRAAGALPVFASGNVNAFKCGSILEPAGSVDAIAVGGVNSGELYPSSGKGPGLDGHTIKPDFVAPSFAIYSALSAADSGHDAYTRLTGTSMATPHVSGALALLLSVPTDGSAADPLAALRKTAVEKLKRPILAPSSCGNTSYTQYPNNLYGWGLPDVCAAAAAIGGKCPQT